MEMVRNWPIACGSAFAQRALEWRPFRSPRVATRDYFGGGAWTAARTCNMPYRNAAHNPRHCDTRPVRGRRPPAKYGRNATAPLDLLTSSSSRPRYEMSPP